MTISANLLSFISMLHYKYTISYYCVCVKPKTLCNFFANLAIWRIEAASPAFSKVCMQELIEKLISPFL